jgi:mannose-6-phosphate isomerase-like protein (cupin superfamily)
MSSQAQPENRPAASGLVVEEGAGRTRKPLPVVGDEVTIKISSRDTNGAFATFIDTTPPQAGPPLHRHHLQDEWWYILEGNYLFDVDGKEIHAGQGDTVYAPRGSVHTFMNTGSAPARSLITVVPGGLDLFFEDLSAAAPTADAVAANPELVAQIFQKHGLELLGPPLWAKRNLSSESQ